LIQLIIQLITRQQDFQKKKTKIQTQVDELQEEYDQLQAELADDETHQTLSALDEKLRLIEEDNEAMNAFIDDRKKKHTKCCRTPSLDYGNCFELLEQFTICCLTT